jgi:hypothetical protein
MALHWVYTANSADDSGFSLDTSHRVRMTGDSDLTVVALLSSLIGGTEATGHEAAAKFQKKTQ